MSLAEIRDPATGHMLIINSDGSLNIAGGAGIASTITVKDASDATHTLKIDAAGEASVTTYQAGGSATATFAGGTTSNVVVKNSAGRLCRVLVTAAGSAALDIYDNASTNSGTIIAHIPANTAAGTVYDLQMPCAQGITVKGAASTPSVTISYL